METGFQQFLYKYIGKHIPPNMTPKSNDFYWSIVWLFGYIVYFLFLYPSIFIGTIIGLIIHLVADDLDGYIARTQICHQSGRLFRFDNRYNVHNLFINIYRTKWFCTFRSNCVEWCRFMDWLLLLQCTTFFILMNFCFKVWTQKPI